MEDYLTMRPDFEMIKNAHRQIMPYIHRTPILTNSSLNTIIGTELFFKCENFQKVGAFKFRGACNAIFSLSKEQAHFGVITHSSGNHAAALALAARMRDIKAHIVMPSTAPPVKIKAVQGYGGMITFCEPTLSSRESTANQIIKETNAIMIHPFNNFQIIAGQATAALELLEEVTDLDFILAPVGGGGLLSGTAITAKSLNPKIRVIGCEPQNANDAYQSKKAGHIIPSCPPNTIADGLLTSLGDKTFPIIQELVDDIILASEENIVQALRYSFERMKIVIEPSSAVPLASLLGNNIDIRNKKVGIIISGGNVDLNYFFDQLLTVNRR